MTNTKPMIFTPQKEFEVWKSLIHLKTELEIHQEKWANAGRFLGSAYQQAYVNHTKVLEKRSKQSEIDIAIYAGAITALTAGILGSVGETLAKGSHLHQLWANVEDTVQAGIGEWIDIEQQKIGAKSTNLKVDKHPFLFQNSLLMTLHDQWLKIMDFLYDIETRLYDLDPSKRNSLKNYSELQEELNEFKKNKNQMKLFSEPKTSDFEYFMKRLEIWMWAKWWGIVCANNTMKYEFPGKHVERRTIELGIAQKCSVDIDWTEKRYAHSTYSPDTMDPVEFGAVSKWFRDYLDNCPNIKKENYL